MERKSSNKEEREPAKYFSEVDAAKKEKTPEQLVKTLRADLLPGSHAVPAREKIYQRINFKLIFGLLLALIVLVLIWYALAGAGRALLESRLSSLLPTAVRTMPLTNPSPLPVVDKPPAVSQTPYLLPTAIPTETPLPTRTRQPTSSPTVIKTATQTIIPPTTTSTFTPTPENTCREATTITLADVGKSLCVRGIVIETIEKPNNFMVIFSQAKGAFYWVSYDMVWSKAELDSCYQVEGTIRQLGNSPILLFDYSNIPEVCP